MQANGMPRRLRANMGIQRAIMALTLATYPYWRTIPELAREIDEGDTVEHSVVELVCIGLLECRGVSIRPTPAAAHLNRLELP